MTNSNHGDCKSELKDYFHMYTRQLNFTVFCVTRTVGISWQQLSYANFLVCSVYRFHVYFHVQIILHDLDIPLPHKNGSSKVKNSYIKSAYQTKMVLARLKILTLKVHFTVFVMTMVLMQKKHRYMGIGFI